MDKKKRIAKEDKIFRLLQKHLNKQAVGFPATRSGADIRLLQRLFTPDEAKAALSLSYKPIPVEQVIERTAPEFTTSQTEHMLESMLMKGAIGWKKKDGVSYWYAMPLVIGMYESQDGVPTREFMSDAGAYMKTLDYGISFLKTKPSQMPTIPINKTISVDHPIATYNHIRMIIQNAQGPFVVVNCICRQGMAMRRKPCKKTSRLETCLGMNDMARMCLRRSHGREVSRDEALLILQQNEDDGLVLQPANAQHPEFVCSCCGCCCGMLSLQKLLPHPVDFWSSNFYAKVTENTCTCCGKCVSRCQVNAVSLSKPNGTVNINLSRCIGCGLCVSTCSSHTLHLEKKHNVTVPPENEEALNDLIMNNKKGIFENISMLAKVVLKMRQ